jgi:hypothetical protein
VVARRLAGHDPAFLIDGQAQPHAVDRLAGVDVAAVAVGRAVGFGVGEVRLDVVATVGATVAAQDDIARGREAP